MLNSKLSAIATILLISTNSAFAASTEEIRALEPQTYFPTIDPIFKSPDLVEPDVKIFTSGAHYYKRVLTSTKPQTNSSDEFIPLNGAKTYVAIPPGKSALVNVAFTAESRCDEPGSNTGNWCEVAIRVNGSEASPKASLYSPDTYAFDSTDNGTETRHSWESHAMDRHQCVNNEKGTTYKKVPIEVIWKVTNFDGGTAPNFWLDDWSFTVQLAQGCRETNAGF